MESEALVEFGKELTETSLANIGANIGGRDHSTVIHACKNIEKKAQENRDFKFRIHNMKNQISEKKITKYD